MVSWKKLITPPGKSPKDIKEWLGLITDAIKGIKGSENWYDDVTLLTSDSIVNDLETGGVNKALSSEQGKILNQKINDIQSTKTIFLNSMIELKNSSDIKKGMKVSTLGYYEINDGGNADYYITDIIDNSLYQESLNNGLYATIINREINPRQVGCKCDGVSDDTINFQKFLDLFITKNYKLISNGGIIYITSPVYLKGVFSNEEELYELIFINTKIKYIGDSPYAIYIYGHKNSKLKGISLSNDSDGFIGVTSFWYSEIIDMQCKELKFNVSKELIPDYPSNYNYDINTIKVVDSRIRHIIFNNVGYSNSIVFNNCILSSNSNYDYICEFYGDTYNNVKFIHCDMSYSNKAIFNLNDNNPSGSILMIGCYLDSSLPLTINYNSWAINQISNFEASNGAVDAIIDTVSLSKSMKISSRSKNGNILNPYLKNLANNGSLWNIKQGSKDLYGTTFGTNTTYEIIDSSKTINGKAIKLSMSSGGDANYFYGQKSLMTGHYTGYIRFKLLTNLNDKGNLNIGINERYMNYPLNNISVNKEYVINICSDIFIDENTNLILTLHVNNTTTPITIEIYEYGIIFGNTTVMGCELYNPLLKYCNSTNRPIPTPNMIGFNIFDTTLNKRIEWTGIKWVDSQGNDI